MKYKFFYYTIFITLSCFLFTSCIKNEVTDLGSAGKTMIKILESPENQIFFSPFSDVRPVSLFSLRRDANSSAELNKPLTVTVRLDTAAIRSYNTAHNSNYQRLPDSLFTLGSGITSLGGLDYQVTFAPGESAKEFMINLNGAKWDLSKKYAFPVTITDPGGLPISSGKDNVIPLISVKNQWDGVYEVTGTLTDVVVTTITGFYPLKWDLVTSGTTTIIAYDKEYTGTPTHIINTTTGLSQYGSYGLVLTFDPATNKITNLTNYYGQFSGGFLRSAALDPTGINEYDPATKTIRIKYFLLQGNPGTVRTTFDETWKFLGSR